MTPKAFDDCLRTLVRRRPFGPFTIALKNGERIEVDVPHAVSFNNGGGGFIGPNGLISFFKCENVVEIAPHRFEGVA